MTFITKLLLNAAALSITAYILPGIRFSGFWSLILAAFVLGLMNSIVKPILIFLTLPINILTLGLFTLIVNGIVLYLTAAIVSGFEISGFWTAVLGALILSIISMLLNSLL